MAYHLTKLGCSDVVVLEQHTLSAGSTWHAAGAVAQYRPKANLMALAKYSVDLYRRFEAETGLSTGVRQCGGMRVTTSRERRSEYERAITTARSFGLEMHLISPAEAKDLFPIMEVDDLDCAIYVPTDGVVGPSDARQALARASRRRRGRRAAPSRPRRAGGRGASVAAVARAGRAPRAAAPRAPAPDRSPHSRVHIRSQTPVISR
jgi:sarcosine dehydrogenase